MLDPRYEEKSGSGKYMTFRRMLERSGRMDRITDYSLSWKSQWIVEQFWKLKAFLPSIETPLPPNVVLDYCRDQGVLITREERNILYRMDSDFRAALSKKKSEIDRAMAEKAKANK